MAERYEFLHHIADAKFRAYGSTLEETFESAALAMFNIMIDTSCYQPDQVRDIEITALDIKGLLVDWLSELLYLFEVDELLFCEFKIDSIMEKRDGFILKAHASGVAIDTSKHVFDTQVKAVTFHDLEVRKEQDGRYWVQVVVDT